MKLRFRELIAGLLGLLVFFATISFVISKNNGPLTLEKFNSQKIKWEKCYDSFECGYFRVPIDYQKLETGTFKLKVLRHLATDKKRRLGSIVVNPGGPGGSGHDYAFNAESIVSDAINARYDIVGFDGRGIGESEPIRCLSDKEEDKFIDIDGAGDSEDQISNLKFAAKSFAEACAKVAGIKLGHISTFETAKDMEILRNLLKEPKLNYLGKSYGTYLGSIYISLSPDKVGKFVLDGAVDPNIPLRDQSLTQASSFEFAFDEYLNSNNEFSKSQIQNFIEQSGTEPLKLKNGRSLSRSLLVTALAASLYDNKLGWQNLKIGLRNAIKRGDPERLISIADTYNSRDVNGHYYTNENDIGIAINCLDWKTRKSFDEIASDAKNFIAASETFGRYIAYSDLPCTYWKAPPLQPKLPFRDIKSPPFVIIGVTKDPATPYEWAQSLADEFPNSILLTLNGEGHTGHDRGNNCIDSKVDAYFLGGNLPEAGVSCGTDGN